MDKLKIRRMMDDRRKTKRILTGFFVLLLSSLVLLSSSLVSLPSSLVYAEIPHLINYQGRLVDKDTQKPADGLYVMKFTLYDEPGAIKWQATYGEGEASTPVSVSKGVFSVKLGEITDPGSAQKFSDLSFDEPYYLEIAVRKNEPNSQFETLGSRQPLTSTGYAIRAEKAEEANQASNADTIGNVGVSTTPQANKLLPLDNNAKLAPSVLKTFETEIDFTVNSSYTINHNLNTDKLFIQLYVRQNTAEPWNLTGTYIEEPDDDKPWQGVSINIIDGNRITIRFAGGICYVSSEGVRWLSNGKLKIVILCLG